MKREWKQPGEKLREHDAASLTDAELLAILSSTGIRAKPALWFSCTIDADFQSAVE